MPTEREDQIIQENETELQPDPLMKEGRASRVWTWVVGLAVIVIIGIYFYGVGR